MKGKQRIYVSSECEPAERKGVGHHWSLERLVVAHRTQKRCTNETVCISGVKTISCCTKQHACCRWARGRWM